MVFSDLKFIYLFLPIFLLIYYIVPQKAKNVTLFFGSIAFYAIGSWTHPLYTLLLLVSVGVSFGEALLMERYPEKKKLLLAVALVYLFGQLFLFKYEGFLSSSINAFFGLVNVPVNLPMLSLLLPVGISFYVFQAASYLIDVYRGTCRAEKSFINFGAYLCMFPQLIAGPIVTYICVQEHLTKRNHTFLQFSEGLKTFVIGLGLKVILANNVGGLWRDVVSTGFESISTPMAWLAAVAFSLQLYFDFYGYSLMAKGMGQMLGFHIPDNFLHPYIAVSMTEFWRRWHVTLGSWFREYVYIPLGGNRKGQGRTALNLLAVWLLTGLWHGASFNFLLWGFVLFVIITVEKLFLKDALERFRPIGHLYMVIIIPLTWMIFEVTDLSQLGTLLLRMFPFLPQEYNVLVPDDYLNALKSYGWLLAAGIVFSTEGPLIIYKKIKDNIIGALILGAIFAASIYLLNIGLNDPFLYFRF